MRTLQRALTRGFACLIAIGLSAGPAVADIVTDWNAIALGVAGAAGAARPTPTPMLDLAMMNIAVHDAIQAFQQRFESYNAPIVGAKGSPIAAAATAARDVLLNRFPAQTTAINTSYENSLKANGLLPTDPGAAVGQTAAANIIARRNLDGSFPSNPEIFIGGTAPGEWRPTQPGFDVPMSAPWFGNVVPFALKDTDGLLSEPPPPHLGSGAYTKAYNEVKALGARANSSRTPEQTILAYFYSGNFFVMLNSAARSIAATHLSDIGDTARLFALATMAGTDALMSAWNTKRYYNFWRPSTAIAEGENDGNPRTEGDPSWLPLINDPPYPDYTSGANSITSAFMRTLALFFDDDAPFTFSITTTVTNLTQVPLDQRTRMYSRFSDVANDVVEARILLGIHFRFADVLGRRQGRQAADRTFSHLLRPLE